MQSELLLQEITRTLRELNMEIKSMLMRLNNVEKSNDVSAEQIKNYFKEVTEIKNKISEVERSLLEFDKSSERQKFQHEITKDFQKETKKDFADFVKITNSEINTLKLSMQKYVGIATGAVAIISLIGYSSLHFSSNNNMEAIQQKVEKLELLYKEHEEKLKNK